jgi:hypothetical protein
MAFSMLTDMSPEHPMAGLYAPDGVPGLYLHNLNGATGVSELVHPVFHIELLKDGSSVPFDVKATPTLLQLKCVAGEMAQKSSMSENYELRAARLCGTQHTHGHRASIFCSLTSYGERIQRHDSREAI